MTFNKKEIIRFRHCDPAGIVFYPRYLEIINDLVEDWFEVMGYPFNEMDTCLGAGVPTVNLNIKFMQPCRQGDTLFLELVCARIGDSSFDIKVTGQRLEQRILEAYVTLCFTTIGKQISKLSIPEGVRRQMLEYRPVQDTASL
ncbi:MULTISPECIES: acyl-CoA thioesterase [Oceanisphaera]|uniref:Acyl-CoA thioesterase n=1 Tax=Oceanisphaera ostreae TaxID=914151 RepID=A0ABW3KGQ0_9GAMM